MLRHEVASEREAESGAAWLGGEERRRDAIAHRLGDPAAIVLEVDREGTLTINTRLRLEHRIDLGGGERVPSVAVDFEDTGCGIPEAVRDRIATPFFTTKARGTGLGLALARHFVTQHGGALQVESRTGHGTRVRVLLPLRRAA